MNSIEDIKNKCIEAEGRYVGDLNLLTLAAFSSTLKDVGRLEDYKPEMRQKFESYVNIFFTTDMPVAYIVGFELFLGERYKVSKDVLIPRFETEELVLNLEQKIRKKYNHGSLLKIADVCSGSGVIGTSLYLRLKADYKIEVSFVDISPKAIEITKYNARQYKVPSQYFVGDMLAPIIDNQLQFDVVVSNPPYIANFEFVQDTVLSYEPHLALYAKDNGLALYKSLINDIIDVCNDKFCLMLEIGETQSKALNEYLNDIHGYQFEVITDINGYDRNLYLEV